jgi:hypothetical protein
MATAPAVATINAVHDEKTEVGVSTDRGAQKRSS